MLRNLDFIYRDKTGSHLRGLSRVINEWLYSSVENGLERGNGGDRQTQQRHLVQVRVIQDKAKTSSDITFSRKPSVTQVMSAAPPWASLSISCYIMSYMSAWQGPNWTCLCILWAQHRVWSMLTHWAYKSVSEAQTAMGTQRKEPVRQGYIKPWWAIMEGRLGPPGLWSHLQRHKGREKGKKRCLSSGSCRSFR